MDVIRCNWAKSKLEIEYHDKEWGVPLYDDINLFELLLLETMQAGISWAIVLSKREAIRKAFDDFNPYEIASYDDRRIEMLLANPQIIRNSLKIRSAVQNARAFLRIVEKCGSFASYIWQFVDQKPIINAWCELSQIPAYTEISKQMSKDMKQRGFSFVGPTVCYAFMQASGLVNDHLISCFRYNQINQYIQKGVKL
ncbi:MAG: DNA-3-methyladenine glycosylase I [Acidobacteria bacterium]|nr:MAG: DNA-3-methyladenine glycosylase I [Acidobacteriota bacterium]